MLGSLLRSRSRGYRWAILGCLLLQAAQSMCALTLQWLTAAMIDTGLAVGDGWAVARVGALMTVVGTAQLGSAVAALRIAVHVSASIGRDLRREVFRTVLAMPSADVRRLGSATLNTRTIDDPQRVQAVVLLALLLAGSAPVLALGGILLALRESVRLASVIAVAVGVIGIVVTTVIRRMLPLNVAQQARTDDLTRIVREQVTGMPVIRALRRGRREQQRFAERGQDLMRVSVGLGRLGALMSPAGLLVINVSSVAALLLGGGQVGRGTLSVGELGAFLGFLAVALSALVTGSYLFVALSGGQVSADRIGQVLTAARPPAIRAPAPWRVRAGPERPALLELVGVRFAHHLTAEPALSDVHLSVRCGEVVAIVGPTGSGKSTLLSLMSGALEATGGAVLLHGVDVRGLDRAAVARSVAMVPQRPVLFSGTIASNLRLACPSASDQELWWALEVADLGSFVRTLPAGLTAPVAQGGANLSGGQRQRLTIARAVLARPELYLLDMPFSAVDAETRARVRTALWREMAGSAVVIVVQDLHAARHADQILLLGDGRLRAVGRHDDLMTTNDEYRRLLAVNAGTAR